MKKLLITTICLIFAFSFVGCSKSNNAASSSSEASQATNTKTVLFHYLSMKIPEDWTITEKNESKYIYPTNGGLIVLQQESTAAALTDYTEENALIVDEIIDFFNI